MAAFTLVIASLKTAYDTFRTNQAATVAAQAALTGLGTIPAYPMITILDADWNDVTTAREAWQASYDAANTTLIAARAAQRGAELLVIHYLGYLPANTPAYTDGQVYNEWVKVVGAGAGVLTYTHWIGAAAATTLYLTISTSQPTQAFPNI